MPPISSASVLSATGTGHSLEACAYALIVLPVAAMVASARPSPQPVRSPAHVRNRARGMGWWLGLASGGFPPDAAGPPCPARPG